MERDLERVHEIYRSYDRRDIPRLFQLISEDVRVVQSTELPWGGDYAGHAGLRRFLATLAEHIDSHVELERLIDAGHQVVAVGRTVGKTRKTKVEFDVPLVHVWTFHEGQVVRFEAYIDNATLLAALRP